ncbi:hypothetical protein [Anabaena azotica]|uniref:Uncharacterized protein n=1 Tax=Anabaena azotica FACHB-119 TaxID=947527 RepID=A0ABR8DFK1_9NOST|nr:hypothetical protein [Anabaena azotica]MBD2505175.1 hypothetical protein [Anabaena azotica FACHB-119]
MATQTKTAIANLSDDLLQLQKPVYSSLTVAILRVVMRKESVIHAGVKRECAEFIRL